MTILVTGGAGFIASHIVDEHIAKGHRVVVLDNLETGFRKNINTKAIFYKADIRDRAAVERIFKKERPAIVNHHAARAAVVESLVNPIPTFEVNVLGTANILLAFGKYGKGKKRFIFSSTGGAIYGEPKKLPADEQTPTDPLSPYGLSKAMGEDLIRYYAREYRFSYVILRYSNVYGPRQNPKGEAGVVAIFGGLMKRNKQPIIYGDGTKSRDYLYVADVVRANVAGLTKGKNETVNLGWGMLVSDRMIFDAVANACGFSGKPRYAPYRSGEVYKVSLSAKRAKLILGWMPKTTLADGVQKTVTTL